MDKDIAGVLIFVCALLAILLGACLVGVEQQLRCYETVKDKTAAEIHMLCK